MDEMNQNLPPRFGSALNDIYSVEHPDPIFIERLESQLHRYQIELIHNASSKQKLYKSHSTNRNSNMPHTTRPIIVIIIVLLALFLLTGIAYAFGWLSGFIPGIGFVNNAQFILENTVVVTREVFLATTSVQPVEENIPQVLQTPTVDYIDYGSESTLIPTSLPIQEKEGITIVVEQVIAEPARLVILYKIAGLPADLFGPERAPTLQTYAETHPDEPMQEQISLPDGTLLDHMSGGHCSGEGDLATSWLSCQSIYAPLPDGVNQFTLQIGRLQNAMPGELPEDWVLTIQLTPVSSFQAANDLEEPNLSSPSLGGITMRLLKVDRSSQQTAFQMSLEWDGNQMVNQISPITLQDNQGHYYTLSTGQGGDHWSPDNPDMITMESVVTGLDNTSDQLTFRLDWAVLTSTDRATIRFDPGRDAKIDKVWS